jgi:protein-S-isoprenylcysteine O-methyltransferase Ste14
MMVQTLKSIRHFVGYRRILLSITVGIVLYVFAMPTTWTIIAGLPLILVGEGIRIWSSGHITKNTALVRTGPYAWIRHPLYLGNFLIGFGFAVMTAQIRLMILYLIAFGFIYYSTISEEETFLRERFGREYEEYARRVPLFLPRPKGIAEAQSEFQWKRVRAHREYKTWLAIGILLVLMIFKSYYVS